ncbi:MAG: GNAT family N-acetyltransferase [Chloroflexi bacterium]|nr:GNAT family N-acetyltransferase [Chloroflexota bacterium]
MKIESLESARLRIRQFAEDDLEHCWRFRRDVFGLDEGLAPAQRWLRWTVDSYRELANLGQPPYADYAIVLKDGGDFVGSVGIVPTLVPWGALKGDAQDSLLSPEIGLFWGILPEFRLRGYATEAARALLDYLFYELKARQVVATTERDNVASRRTMEKLGMTLLENPNAEPSWRQVVGFMANPQAN